MLPLAKQAGRFYGVCERNALDRGRIKIEYRVYEKKMTVRRTPEGQHPYRVVEYSVDKGWA
eukprot:7481037-Lingulodinium_polyedra.AAC.1